MESISNHLASLEQTTSQKDTATCYQPIDSKRIGHLFIRFGAIWGNKWKAQFSDAATIEIIESEWSQGLAGLSDAAIMNGIAISRGALEWPPSIAEFKRLCLGLPDRSITINKVLKGGGDALSDAIIAMIGEWEVKTRTAQWVEKQAGNLYEYALKDIGDTIISDTLAIEAPKHAAIEQ